MAGKINRAQIMQGLGKLLKKGVKQGSNVIPLILKITARLVEVQEQIQGDK